MPVGTPEQVAELAVYPASDDAAYLTGQTMIIDGGASAHQPRRAMARIVHAGMTQGL